MTIYKYGMKSRPYSIGCQPMQNLIEAQEDPAGIYWNILLYSAPLTPEEINHYSLVDLQQKPGIKAALIDLYKGLNKPFLHDLNDYAKTETGQPLIKLITIYDQATKNDPQPDFIEYINDLKNNNSISSQVDYYEIIDYMKEEARRPQP